MADIVKETEEKIRNEISKVKFEYTEKQDDLRAELKNLESEISTKNLEIEKLSMKCSLLENELDRFRKGNISMDDIHSSKLLVLEKNMETTFQKLVSNKYYFKR